MGVLAVDATADSGPDFLTFHAPRSDEGSTGPGAAVDLAEVVYGVVAAHVGRTVDTSRSLAALMRQAGQGVKYTMLTEAVDDLVVAERLRPVYGKRGAKGYFAVPPTVSQAGVSGGAL
jgi:hypothetical protein